MTVTYDGSAIITLVLVETEQQTAQKLIQRKGPNALQEEFEGLLAGRAQKLEEEEWKERRQKHRGLSPAKKQQMEDILDGVG